MNELCCWCCSGEFEDLVTQHWLLFNWEAKTAPMASVAAKTEAKRVLEFKKKKEKRPIWPRVQSKPRQKAGSMASGAVKIEAEGPSMASVLNRGQKPQYASVPEPVQNIKNNRCQRPLLHWCNNDDWMLVYLFIKKKEKSNITYYSYYPMTYCSIQWLVIKRKL